MRKIIDEPFDLVAFAVSVDRWLLRLVDGPVSPQQVALDQQAAQILRRDDVRALLEPALRDAPQDVFAIASRIILVLVPSAVAGRLPLSFDPPLVAAIALQVFELARGRQESSRPSADAQKPLPRLQSRRLDRRRSRHRWRTAASCKPTLTRRPASDREAGAATHAALVDLAQRPKHWHCTACGWRCDEDYNDYLCGQCGAIRPFVGGSATMMQCRACAQWNLALARFCEWCGTAT